MQEKTHPTYPKPAPKVKRFINFTIDYFLIGTIGGLLFLAATAFVCSCVWQEGWLSSYQGLCTPIGKLVCSMIALIIYYSLSEYWLKGKTIGKLITQTRVVSASGQPLRFRQILLRSCARFIPFETIAYLLGRPSNGGWHDQISQTLVVEDRR